MIYDDIQTRALSSDGGIGGFLGGGGTISCDLQLIPNFASLPVSDLFGKFKLLASLTGLISSDLTAGSDLSLSGPIEIGSSSPKPDCGERQNGGEGSDNAFVMVTDKIADANYQRNKRALQDGTVFIAILTGAGAIWWWMACLKR